MVEEAYQSLYRRYRPQRFSEVRGQDHVTLALRNSVRNGTVNHAYLFSGPRGTGKTSSARILAKALNCVATEDGEPCGRCPSCTAVAAGSSLDVHELDAASNNGVEAMRELVSRAALGTPGRWKVYIIDEVHMLSAAASNALLKTLEEPPGHVVFVLATTDPQKVLDTIKSRTQHFEFRLLGGEVLSGLLNDVSADAHLSVPKEALELAVRRGHGSARDALSFLDQVAAAGVIDDDTETVDRLIEALTEGDVAGILSAVAEAAAAGRDPQRLGNELIGQLRNGFLASMAPELVPLPDEAREAAGRQAGRLGTAALVRIIEKVGEALVDMRESLDPRVFLEVVLIRLVRIEADVSLEALSERVGRLEQRLADLAGGTRPDRSGPGATPDRGGPGTSSAETTTPGTSAVGTAEPGPGRPSAAAREALGAVRNRPSSPAAPPPPPGRAALPASRPSAPESPPAPAPGGGTGRDPAGGPTRDEIVKAWGDGLLATLPARPRSRYRTGRFVGVEGAEITFAVPNEPHRRFCEECRPDVEDALSRHFGRPLGLRLVLEPEDTTAGAPIHEPEEVFDLSETVEAPPVAELSVEARLLEAFPGAEEVG